MAADQVAQLHLAVGLLLDNQAPELFLIPSMTWITKVNATFTSNDYGDGYKSKPQWSLNVSNKNMADLEPYRFSNTVNKLIDQ